MSAHPLFEALKPFLWLAVAAFLAGFLSYGVVGVRHASRLQAAPEAPRVSAPVSKDWNLPKHI